MSLSVDREQMRQRWTRRRDRAANNLMLQEAADVLAVLDALEALAEAARTLSERIEMDESVGICLSDRVPSLRLAETIRTFGLES